jgi:YbgC/YbaW family acyl-CoA thioester hydrolase
MTPLSEHRVSRRVQFSETDAAGLVHFSCFFRYMEEAEHALWRAAGLSIFPVGADFGWPRLQTSFEFYRPLRFEDEFEAAIRIVAMDESTIRYECLLAKGKDKIAKGSLTIVCVSKRPGEPMKTIPMPAEIKDRLRPATLGGEERKP